MVWILSDEQIDKMRVAGRCAASVLEMIEEHVKPGVSTAELDRICHEYIVDELDCIPAPLGYQPSGKPPFPKSICTSVNQVICHGIPSEKKILRSGDILNIDVTVIKDGWHGDTSRMFCLAPDILSRRLVRCAQECLYRGIDAVRPAHRLGEIGSVISSHAASERFSVVRDYGGHGIGLRFHEEPHVPHFGTSEDGEMMEPGMAFTIEPMINIGTLHTKTLGDNWTVVTKDHKRSAQFEHTILVTKGGYEVLTLREGEKIESTDMGYS